MGDMLLVTGGAGYVGSHTAHALIARGHKVVVADRLSTGHRAAVPAAAEFVALDLRDAGDVARLFQSRRFDAILHFASLSLVGESMADPLGYLGDNTAGAVNLLRAAARSGVKRFVLSSTANLFDQAGDKPVAEDAPVAPGSPYGESKFLIERMLHWADRALGIRSASLRYFNAAGAHPQGHLGEDHRPETHLVPLVIQSALGKRRAVTVFGTDYPTPDGTCVRDYVHVMDLAEAHIAVLEPLKAKSLRYNLGTGRGHSVNEVIRAVEEVGGRKVPVEAGPRRAGDPAVLVADPSAIKRDLGWKPRFDTLRGIVETAWRWHEKHPEGFGG
ncbi:MAG: UDP-glucose 4-epimerase GalE [Rhodospirillales bacterium]